jgi:hypothetical protein
MLTISQAETQRAGGFLAVLTDKSCEYIRSLLPQSAVVGFDGKEADLERIIVHTNPHLDEYFAEFIFRSCLPKERRGCGFAEQSIYSKTADLACQHLWPTAAVLGIGGTVSGGVNPLFLFDEHVIDEEIGKSKRTASSCSQLVSQKLIRRLPPPLEILLSEVNAIDEYANAHEQNLANLIKPLHEVRFTTKIDPASGNFVSDFLTPDWKRAIVDASITAIAYCLQEKIDLVGNPDDKKALLKESLENYKLNSPHSSHPDFEAALKFIRDTYFDQAKVFSEAVLKKDEDRNGKIVKVPILDAAGNEIPQLFLLSRVVFACEHCWGENIRNIIATHFWEVAMQSQLNFILVRRSVAEMFDKNVKRFVSSAGAICREVLPPMNVGGGRKFPVWLVSIAPTSSVFLANKGVANFINEENNVEADSRRRAKGCGLVLVQDRIQGTTALFKCSAISDDKWEKLVNLIRAREPDCWHVVPTPSGGIASFILNGNKTHRHVPRTGLDIVTLSGLVRHTFY